MYYEPDEEHKVNRIEVKGETVFDFDLSQGWKVASVTWRDHDRLMICVERMDEPQTESTGSPIGDYRDGVGAWQKDCEDRYAIRTDSGEVVAHACPLGCEQTDCPWR